MIDIGGDAHPFQGVLQCTNIFCPHVHDGVGIAAHGSGVDYLWNAGEDALEVCWRDRSPAEQLHICLDGEAVDSRVDVYGKSPNTALSDQFVDPPFYCRGGKADNPADISVVRSGVVAKLPNDVVVDCVHGGIIRAYRANAPPKTQEIRVLLPEKREECV